MSVLEFSRWLESVPVWLVLRLPSAFSFVALPAASPACPMLNVPLAVRAYTFTYGCFWELCGWLVGWNWHLGML